MNAAPEPPDPAMLDAIARQLLEGAGERFDTLTPVQLAEERQHVTWWIEACHAAGYALLPLGADGVVAALPDRPTRALLATLVLSDAACLDLADRIRRAGVCAPEHGDHLQRAAMRYALLRLAIKAGDRWPCSLPKAFFADAQPTPSPGSERC